MPTTKHMLSDTDYSTLTNICMSAAERFTETEKAFRALIDAPEPGPDEMFVVRGDAAKRLADQFALQAAEARIFANLFQSAHPVTLTLDKDDEDDEDAG